MDGFEDMPYSLFLHHEPYPRNSHPVRVMNEDTISAYHIM